MPPSVHTATDPAAPKSTSSGWAVTTRIRSMPSMPAPTVIGDWTWVSDTLRSLVDRSGGETSAGPAMLPGGGPVIGSADSVVPGLPGRQVGQPGVIGEDLDDGHLETDAGLDALDLE